MRIQHNIMAMNAYRNYTNNTSALSKNLEKLSSGYKINRAGDDAAGLAISEKMRAQITGLETAQKNAKDGISLVQTAEGALTEVHDMLNRMVELADQSANGTYDNDVDRANLNKELEQLKSEINRIADSSNFNGIKLLDGSMDASGATGGGAMEISFDTLKPGTAAQTSVAPEFSVSLDGLKINAAAAGSGTINIQIGTQTLTLGWAASKATASGASIALGDLTNKGASTVSIGGVSYKITVGSTINFKASSVPSTASDVNPDMSVSFSNGTNCVAGGSINSGTQVIQVGRKEVKAAPGVAEFTVTEGMLADKAQIKIGDQTFTIDYSSSKTSGTTIGVKDLLLESGKLDSEKVSDVVSRITKAASGNKYFTVGNSGSKLTLQVKSGLNPSTTPETTKEIQNLISITGATSAGKALTLQIGDTSDPYNQLNVNIQDMHAKSLGIADITIADQAGAQQAVSKIKEAINTVSSVRGTLGATQNRLDHTINNLSVMTENIQDAESTIRDTDVAEEMMAYTKNNILVQSAQAMLAQANQVPQGVLQLLQ